MHENPRDSNTRLTKLTAKYLISGAIALIEGKYATQDSWIDRRATLLSILPRPQSCDFAGKQNSARIINHSLTHDPIGHCAKTEEGEESAVRLYF